MNRTMISRFLAALSGLALSLLAGAGVLLWQHHQRSHVLESHPPMANMTALAPESAAAQALSAWLSHRHAAAPFSDGALHACHVLDTLNAAACRALAASASAQPEPDKHQLLGDVLGRWIVLEPAEAMTWALRHLSVHDPILAQTGLVWAWRDPAALVAWYEAGLSGEETLRAAFKRLDVPRWLPRSDTRLCARTFALDLAGRNSGGTRYTDSLVVDEAVTTPQAAAVFAAEVATVHRELFADEKAVHSGIQRLVGWLRRAWLRVDRDGWDHWATEHPKLARWARTGNSSDEELYFHITSDLTAAATRWIEKAPAEEQAEIMRPIIDTWAARDLDAAGVWLAAQGGGERTWAAVESFARHAAAVDPEAAFQWAATIGDPARRARAERQAFLRWHDAEPSAAMAWLEHSGWSEDQQTAVREMAAVRGR